MLLAAGDERRSGAAERELAPVPGGIGDDHVRPPSRSSTIVDGSDSPPKCQIATAAPTAGQGARRLHERPRAHSS